MNGWDPWINLFSDKFGGVKEKKKNCISSSFSPSTTFITLFLLLWHTAKGSSIYSELSIQCSALSKRRTGTCLQVTGTWGPEAVEVQLDHFWRLDIDRILRILIHLNWTILFSKAHTNKAQDTELKQVHSSQAAVSEGRNWVFYFTAFQEVKWYETWK